MPSEERLPLVRQAAAERVLRWIDRTLERFGVVFDTYMSEASLAEKHEIEQAIERLRAAGHIYEEDGAVWFRSTTFGDDKDRVGDPLERDAHVLRRGHAPTWSTSSPAGSTI